jgi:hypothetical protein
LFRLVIRPARLRQPASKVPAFSPSAIRNACCQRRASMASVSAQRTTFAPKPGPAVRKRSPATLRAAASARAPSMARHAVAPQAQHSARHLSLPRNAACRATTALGPWGASPAPARQGMRSARSAGRRATTTPTVPVSRESRTAPPPVLIPRHLPSATPQPPVPMMAIAQERTRFALTCLVARVRRHWAFASHPVRSSPDSAGGRGPLTACPQRHATIAPVFMGDNHGRGTDGGGPQSWTRLDSML